MNKEMLRYSQITYSNMRVSRLLSAPVHTHIEIEPKSPKSLHYLLNQRSFTGGTRKFGNLEVILEF